MNLSPVALYRQHAARRAAGHRLTEAKKLLGRARGNALDPADRGTVQAAMAALRDASKRRDLPALRHADERLAQLMDKHLGPWRKPAWRESFESIGVAVGVALLLRCFVVEAFKIPSGSMIPTLAIGDQIFVNKFVYGVRVPFTSIRIIDFSAPARGDVIVFICPEPPNDDYIKRVVGLPGDKIAVQDGVVTVNGQPVPRVAQGERTFWDRDSRGETWRPFTASVYTESLGDHTFNALQDTRRGTPDYRPFVVPPDHVFMMGDNRDNSHDSRAWGPAPVNNILGRAMFVWWSWGRNGIDFSRIGTWVG